MLKRLASVLASNPRAYEIIQTLLGQRVVRAAIASVLPDRNVLTLDIGSASGGAVRRLVSRTIATDIDFRSLAMLRLRDTAAWTVQCNASHLALRDRAVQTTTCVAVSHHLDDPTLCSTLKEIARVTSGVLVFADAVRNDARLIARLLWHYDRGANPRTAEELQSAIARDFEIEKIIRVTYLHQYWIAVARVRGKALA